MPAQILGEPLWKPEDTRELACVFAAHTAFAHRGIVNVDPHYATSAPKRADA